MGSLPGAKANEQLIQSTVYTFPNSGNLFLMGFNRLVKSGGDNLCEKCG